VEVQLSLLDKRVEVGRREFQVVLEWKRDLEFDVELRAAE